MKVIQLTKEYSKGSGVGNVITAIDILLKKQGYDSIIVNRELTYNDIGGDDFQGDNVVLYHVALSVDPLISYIKCKKIMIFHNITDPELLLGTGLEDVRVSCSAGLYDVSRIAKYFQGAIVFSEYSKRILFECGWDKTNIYQLPIMVRFDNLAQDYDRKIVESYSDGYTNIIFTGRIFPNKRQEDIIRSFAEYQKIYNKRSRLFIVGAVSSTVYYKALQELVKSLNLEESVIFTGRAPFAEYLSYYHLADVFLCMSAHEGFCIPLVEAMYFEVPIIAVNGTAIPDTLSGCGVLLEGNEVSDVAFEINRIVSDKTYRKNILEGERLRLKQLLPKTVEKKYADVLKYYLNEEKTREILYKELPKDTIILDELSCSGAITQEACENVIYGIGTAGKKLMKYMKNMRIEVAGVCDQAKGGTREEDIDIIYPQDAFIKYGKANYIISVQDKYQIREIMRTLIAGGIHWNQIFIYDEIKGEIA